MQVAVFLLRKIIVHFEGHFGITSAWVNSFDGHRIMLVIML